MANKSQSKSILAIFILLILFVGILINIFDGPTWFTNKKDPDYAYLLNGLNYAMHHNGDALVHNHHPGTPFQLYNSFIIQVIYKIIGTHENLQLDVIYGSEVYLEIINFSFLIFSGFFLFKIGERINKKLKLKYTALILLTPLLSYYNSQVLSRASTEMALMPSVLALLWLVLITLQENDFLKQGFSIELHLPLSRNKQIWSLHFSSLIFAIGVFSGLALATKITILPFLLIVVAALPNIKEFLTWCFWTALAFIFFTWPIIYKYKIIYLWFFENITRKGGYATGEIGFLDTSKFITHITMLFVEHPYLFIFSALALSWGLYFLISNNLRKHFKFKEWRVFFASLIATIAIILIEVKSPKFNYSIPYVVSTLLPLYLIFKLKKQIQKPFIWLILISLVYTAGLTSYRTYELYKEWQEYRQRCHQYLQIETAASGLNHECSKMSDGYSFGSDWSGHYHLEKMRELGLVPHPSLKSLEKLE